jgi:hypothetical protein
VQTAMIAVRLHSENQDRQRCCQRCFHPCEALAAVLAPSSRCLRFLILRKSENFFIPR